MNDIKNEMNTIKLFHDFNELIECEKTHKLTIRGYKKELLRLYESLNQDQKDMSIGQNIYKRYQYFKLVKTPSYVSMNKFLEHDELASEFCDVMCI